MPPLPAMKTMRNLLTLTPLKRRTTIKREGQTHLYEDGWRRTGWSDSKLTGYYRTRHGSFKGRVEHLSSTKPSFYIYCPHGEKLHEALSRHSHWTCFHNRGNHWYYIHFSQVPRELDSAYLTIKRIINEAFLRAKKTA